MSKSNFQTKDKDFELAELKHSMNNDLAIINSFLELCHMVEGDETFKACLNQFNLTMPQADAVASVQILNTIREAAKARLHDAPLPAQKIEQATRQAGLSEANRDFAFLYAGALVAKHARGPQDIALATSLLGRVKSHPFASRLARFLQEHGELKPRVAVFGDVAPFDGWKKTRVYSSYMNGDVEQVLKFAREHPLSDATPTIFDVGTGSGVLISMIVNRLANELGLRRVRIILNDQSPNMLKNAEAYCRQNISIPCDLVVSECRAEDISDSEITRLSQHKPIWFVHASASLHHMPKDRKIDAFKRLGRLSDHLLLAEFNGNHDLPEPNSPELFYSLAGFYGYLFRDILDSPATTAEQNATIDQFLLAEAIIVMRSEHRQGSADQLGRVDYHTTPEEWRDVADQSGYIAKNYTPLVTIKDGRPVTYFFHFERNGS